MTRKIAANPHYELHTAREAIAHMVRRNEKALLGPALAEWNTTHAPHDDDVRATEEQWYAAACHKQGTGVVELLQQAGIGLHSWVPVSQALERNLDDVAFAMALLNPRLPPLEPRRKKNTHVLVEAACRGRLDVLEALFGRPTKVDEEVMAQGGTPNPAARANDLLLALSRLPEGRMQQNMDAVVGFLVQQGGDVGYRDPQGLNVVERTSLVFHAAGACNATMLAALHAHGADLREVNESQAYMPHPLPNAQCAVLHAIGDHYYKDKQITPAQWRTMELLADAGVIVDPEGMDDAMRKLPGNVPPWEREKIKAVAERARAALAGEALDADTVQVSPERGRLRL